MGSKSIRELEVQLLDDHPGVLNAELNDVHHGYSACSATPAERYLDGQIGLETDKVTFPGLGEKKLSFRVIPNGIRKNILGPACGSRHRAAGYQIEGDTIVVWTADEAEIEKSIVAAFFAEVGRIRLPASNEFGEWIRDRVGNKQLFHLGAASRERKLDVAAVLQCQSGPKEGAVDSLAQNVKEGKGLTNETDGRRFEFCLVECLASAWVDITHLSVSWGYTMPDETLGYALQSGLGLFDKCVGPFEHRLHSWYLGWHDTSLRGPLTATESSASIPPQLMR